MSFNFRVIFSGLCAFVPDQPVAPEGPVAQQLTGMQVVMVDARKWAQAVDSGKLKPHFPIAVIDAVNLQGQNGVPPGTRLEWRLDRRELKFVIADGTPKDFALVRGGWTQPPFPQGTPQTATPTQADDFGWGAHMTSIAPSFATIDPDCFLDGPSSLGLTVARVVLDRGELANRGFAPATTPWYYFDSALGGGGPQAARPYSNKTTLELQSVHGVELVARDLDGQRPDDKVALTGPDGGWVEITVSNMDDGRLPEVMPDPNPQLNPADSADTDFRWFYSLCANRSLLGSALSNNDLPYPKHSGGGGPGTVQCMHAMFVR
jgi:hypothetical protein